MPLKVLIIRFSSIGDIVLTTPVIRAVKEQTDAAVHFLTKQSFSTVLRHHPGIDRLWTIEKNISEISSALGAERFDHVIDLHGNLRTAELRTRLLINHTLHLRPRPKWSSFHKLNFAKFLLTRLGINRLPDRHIVDRYLDAARALSVVNDGRGLDFFIAEKDRVDLGREKIPGGYLAFVIGAAHATKRLTEDQMVAFCAAFRQPIVLLGGPDERAAGARIAHDRPHVINACGRFSLGGSADLVRQAAVVLTHDTGLMHIAAAFGKPIVSVWGNTVPDFGMYPYLPGNEVAEQARRWEVNGLPCRPCSKIGHESCPKGHFRCIKDQDPVALAGFAASLINELR